jgi:hypothetical protein
MFARNIEDDCLERVVLLRIDPAAISSFCSRRHTPAQCVPEAHTLDECYVDREWAVGRFAPMGTGRRMPPPCYFTVC